MDKAIPIISQIAKSRKNKHKFAYYTAGDISQEIWALCLDALKRYDSSSGELENYLNKHISNRMKNLKRDRYFRPEKDINNHKLVQKKINLVNALPIEDVPISDNARFLASSSEEPDPLLTQIAEDMTELIIKKLPTELVSSFRDLLCGIKINKNILKEIRQEVSVILGKI